MSNVVRHDPQRRPPPQPASIRPRTAGTPGAVPSDADVRARADAQAIDAELEGLDDAAPAIEPQRQQGGDAGSDGGSGRPAGDQAAGADGAPAEAQRVDHQLARIGQFVSHVHQAARDQGQWSLSLPLDSELLRDTILHLGYSPTLVTLRFETRDWESRELLSGRTRALEELVRQLLPPGCEAVVSV